MDRILIVEDDHALAVRLREFFEKHGYVAAVETRGNNATTRLTNENFDIVVLDWMLPDTDGTEVCRAIKRKHAHPILMLTARDGDHNEIQALDAGADDYLAKPVRPAVLLARVRALLRRIDATRTPTNAAITTIVNGALIITLDQRTVHMSGNLIELTTAEYDLLLLLARNVGRVFSREELYLVLRGIQYDGLDRSLDLRVARIRKKLNDHDELHPLIKSVRSVGYMMVRRP
jgi:two-component system, OmpR family, response regulator RstA